MESTDTSQVSDQDLQVAAEPGQGIRLAIVDDHPLIAQGLHRILAEERDFEVVGTASSVAEAFELIEEQRPEVVLMDYWLGDGDGADAAQRILKRRPDLKIIILSGNGEPEILSRAIEVGCVGYLSKSRPWTEIADAVRAASRGEAVMQAQDLSGLFVKAEEASSGRTRQLTEVEGAVLRLLAKMRSTAWIATELQLPDETVAGCETSILRKLGARWIREALDTAQQMGLIRYP